ncbi:FMN-binding negative transcriptional regulator [Acinetobacter sp.]|uniref:FMN-binding negative transcriptional regulator n=1 Tax=Acinetobacter sp. TaxID=472 RepID=UPI002FD99841
MYLPEIFEEKNPQHLYQLIQNYPFATLISHSPNGLEANHFPFKLLRDEENNTAILVAHIAKNNAMHKHIQNGSEVLVIFQGEQGYISPNWYPSKQQHHRHVPTWNYQVVHIKGKIYFSEDEKSLRGILARLTRTHEATQAIPWKMSDAPEDYITEQLQHIVAIEIHITEMTGKFKMSQNRDKVDALGIVEGLEKQGDLNLAKVVQQYIID